jgi:hypothetical protein
MTTLHAQLIGDKGILPREEFDRLVELARRSEEIKLHMESDEIATVWLMRLAELGGAFDWLRDEPDVYTVDDLKVRYR